MKVLNKNIFGKNYSFESESDLLELVNLSTRLYADCTTQNPDVIVSIVRQMDELPVLSQNPGIHRATDSAIDVSMNGHRIRFGTTKNGSRNVILHYRSRTGLRAILRKANSMEFANELEEFEQILYELILVPSLYFFDDRVPVHAAAVSHHGATTLIFGTGGVGKSSTLVAMRDSPDHAFVSDDIAVLDGNSDVYGNMAWPKIYGYNCENTDLESKLLAQRSAANIIHFKVKNHINPKTVRRKIEPDALFKKVESGKSSLARVICLFRENVTKPQISDISDRVLVEMMLQVFITEYQVFHNHIHWHEYNALGRNDHATITMKATLCKWSTLLESALKGKKLQKLSIPVAMPHGEFLEYISTIVVP